MKPMQFIVIAQVALGKGLEGLALILVLAIMAVIRALQLVMFAVSYAFARVILSLV